MLWVVGVALLGGSALARLLIALCFIPLLIVYARKNRPGRFKPDAIPTDVLPA